MTCWHYDMISLRQGGRTNWCKLKLSGPASYLELFLQVAPQRHGNDTLSPSSKKSAEHWTPRPSLHARISIFLGVTACPEEGVNYRTCHRTGLKQCIVPLAVLFQPNRLQVGPTP